MAEFEDGPSLMFMGKKVEITQSMPTVEGDSQVCCLFGTLRMSSTHGVRKDLIIERSLEAKFLQRQVAVMATQRHAVQNHTLGTAAKAGPMVGLITAAA